jgi:hypothetical protein
MNMHVTQPTMDDPQSYDTTHLRVAVESFQGTCAGYLPSFMYDASSKDHNYVGGGQKWEAFISGTQKYKFPKANRFLLSNRGSDIVDAIVNDTNGRLQGHPWHITSLTPGTEYSRQDGAFITSLANVIDARGEELKHLTIDEGNVNFLRRSVNSASENLDIDKKSITQSSRDILRASLETTTPENIKKMPRRSVVVWSGGTVGNVGFKGNGEGFPEKQIIQSLHLQIDFTATECYVVVLHNACTEKDKALEMYSEELQAEFALASMHGIEHHLPTTDFNAKNFRYEAQFNEETEIVSHNAISTTDQQFFIGNAGFRLKKDQHACVIGHSAQISNDRMGNISTKGGFTRVASFTNPLNPITIATVLKATQPLLETLRKGQTYIPSFN